jgi:hypothetical protein
MNARQNHAAKMEQRKQDRLDAGLVSDRFPEVLGMVLNMTYYRKVASPVLMVRTVNVFPDSYAYFHMECMIDGCVNGGFDLTSAISQMVRNRKSSAKGMLSCGGEANLAGSDHASVSYEISIQYRKLSK